MNDINSLKVNKILFISHDGNRAGAQLFLLQVVRYFQEKGHDCHVLFLDNGELVDTFSQSASTYIWQSNQKRNRLYRVVRNRKPLPQDVLKRTNFDWVYVNTIASSSVISWLNTWNTAPLVAHIHELYYSISMYSTMENRKMLFERADRIIACANAVKENLLLTNKIPQNKLVTIHSFVDNETVLKRIEMANRKEFRDAFEIPNTSFCVVSCGNAEWRKGIDLFLRVAAQYVKESPQLPILFIWVGMPKEGLLWEQVTYDVKRLGLEDVCLFIPPIPNAIELIAAMDLFLLPSREDPFPLVMLEAALASKPIIGFEKTGGCTEFVEKDAGITVPYGDTEAMYREIVHAYHHPEQAQAFAQKGQDKVLERYTYETSMQKIEQLMLEMTNT